MAKVERLCLSSARSSVSSGMGLTDKDRLQWLDYSLLSVSSCTPSSRTSHTPFFQRRSVTSYGEFPSIPHVRSRSARYPSASVTMPRSHVSVARFYDWTEDLGDCVSVSRLYRDLANIPKLGDRGKGKNMQWCANGIRVTPGRMFSREKGSLTKGEREIIEGIYRNRGENAREGQKHESPIRSHHEAWLVGKTIAKSPAKQEVRQSCNKRHDDSEFKVPDTLFLKSNSITEENQTNARDPCSMCYFCIRERNGHRHGKAESGSSECAHSGEDEGPMAPPSTPDRLLHRRPRQPGTGSVDTSFSFSDSRDSSPIGSPRRVRVNVYLPAVAAEKTEDDFKSCLIHGQSLLRKERPLSQSDFKRNPDNMSSQPVVTPSSTPSERLSAESLSAKESVVRIDNGKMTPIPFGLELSE